MIDIAVIGLGRWGKGIVEAVQGKSKRLRVIRGVSKEPEQVRDFAGKQGFELSTEFAEAVADPRVKAVVLATPHSLHVDQVVAVAKLGKPVWCEKPLALTRAQAERAVTACRKAGVTLALGNNKRFYPSMQALAHHVAHGGIGELIHIEGHFSNEHSTRVRGGWREDPAEAPGAGMTGAGLHILDAFVNLGGPIRRVEARLCARKPPPDPRDSVAILVEFENGATGLMATVRAAPTYWRVHAFGTRGSAEALGETTLIEAPIGAEPRTRTLAPADSLSLLLEAFGEAVEDGKPFPVSIEQMLATVSAFEAVIDSLNAQVGPR